MSRSPYRRPLSPAPLGNPMRRVRQRDGPWLVHTLTGLWTRRLAFGAPPRRRILRTSVSRPRDFAMIPSCSAARRSRRRSDSRVSPRLRHTAGPEYDGARRQAVRRIGSSRDSSARDPLLDLEQVASSGSKSVGDPLDIASPARRTDAIAAGSPHVVVTSSSPRSTMTESYHAEGRTAVGSCSRSIERPSTSSGSPMIHPTPHWCRCASRSVSHHRPRRLSARAMAPRRRSARSRRPACRALPSAARDEATSRVDATCTAFSFGETA